MKALKIIGIVVAVLVVAGIVFVATFDVSKYKGTIEAQAKAALGRDVTFSDIKLSPSLSPAITLTDLRIANAPWGTRPDMLTAKSVAVHTELVPLLFGTVKLTKITVEDPDAWLETDKSGKGNWDLSAAAAKPTANAPAANTNSNSNLTVNGVDLKNLKVAYKDAQTGRAATVGAKSLDIRLDGPMQEMNVTKIEVGDGSLSMKDAKTSAEGTIGKFVMDAHGPITSMGITNLSLSDAKVNYKADGSPTDAVVDKLSLDKDGQLMLTAKVNGQDFKGKGTLAPIATLVHMDKSFPAKLTLEGLGLKADTDLTIAVQGKRARITGTVTVPEINLAAASGKSASQAPSAGNASGHVFPDTPLPWSMLGTTDADVKLSLGKATLPSGVVLTNVVLPVKLAGGKLALDQFTAGVGGGSVTGSIAMNAGDKSLSIKAEGKGMTAEELAKEMKKGDLITGGPIALNTNIHGAGASMHAIMASASGTFLLTMGESRVKSESSGGTSTLMQVASALNPMGQGKGQGSQGYTVISCAVVNFPISDGVANVNNGIGVVTDKVQANASGTIDFKNERVDLSLHPKAGGTVGGSVGQLAQAFKISGPLASPGVTLDTAGAMRGIASAGAGAALGGASGAGGALGGLLGGHAPSLTGNKSQTQAAAPAPTGNPCDVARIGAAR